MPCVPHPQVSCCTRKFLTLSTRIMNYLLYAAFCLRKGVAQKAPFHMYAQPKLGRVVLDIKTPSWTVPVRDYFLNTHTGSRSATVRLPRRSTVR